MVPPYEPIMGKLGTIKLSKLRVAQVGLLKTSVPKNLRFLTLS